MKKLLLFGAALALFAFPGCKDDDDAGGDTINVKLDYSLISRPQKSQRYRILIDNKVTIADIEAKSVKASSGTKVILAMSNLFYYNYDGPVFSLPLKKDGYLQSTTDDAQFGYGLDTVATIPGQIVESHIELQSIANLQIQLNVKDSIKNHIARITTELDGLIGSWNYLTNMPLGTVQSINEVSTNKSTNYSYKYMYMGFSSSVAAPKLKVTVDLDNRSTPFVYERTVDFDTEAVPQMWFPSVVDTFKFREIFYLRDTLWNRYLDPSFPG